MYPGGNSRIPNFTNSRITRNSSYLSVRIAVFRREANLEVKAMKLD